MEKVCKDCNTLKSLSEFPKGDGRLGVLAFCLSCRNIRKKKYYAENKGKWKDYAKKNKEKIASFQKEQYESNKSERLENNRIYREQNKEAIRAKSREGYWRDREAYIMRARRRQAHISEKATPAWANMEKIKQIYVQAKELSEKHGIEYHVDHIIPLLGKNVSGLHIENNLQILTAEENRKKSNSY